MVNLFCFLNTVYNYLNFFNIDVAFCFYLVLIILLFCAVFFVVYLFLYYSLFLLVTLFLFFFNFIFLFNILVDELSEFFLFFWLNPFSQNRSIFVLVWFIFLCFGSFFIFSFVFIFCWYSGYSFLFFMGCFSEPSLFSIVCFTQGFGFNLTFVTYLLWLWLSK